MKLIIAEKPIAAKRIASILGDPESRKISSIEVFELGDKVIIPLKGHVRDVDFPKEFNNWQKTDLSDLIDVPVKYSTSLAGIKKALHTYANADELIISTDFDREGESIGKEAIDIIREKNAKIKVKRARFSALTPKEVKTAFENLVDFDYNLADAADSRREIDLIWGAVLTRYVSLTSGKLGRNFLSVGRVQTPALALVVDREKEINAFKPEDFWALSIECEKNKEKFTAVYEDEKIFDEKKAKKVSLVKSKEALVKSIEKKKYISKPPTPFNTTEFMRAASNLGIQPKRAMSIAEKLYMEGFTSYPRTDNTYYPESLDLKEILKKFSETKEFGGLAKKLLAKKKLSPTHGKKKTTDHPPIHPVEPANRKKLQDPEWKIYELIVRRFLGTLADDSESESVKSILNYKGENFVARGRTVLYSGWREFYPYSKSEEQYLPELKEKEVLKSSDIISEKKQTKPKPRYTPAALIKLMDDMNLGTKCLTGDTSVKLVDKHNAFDIKLSSLFNKSKKKKKEGNIELAFNEDYNCISANGRETLYPSFSFVSRRKLEPEERMYEVIFSDGVKVKATSDHPFYVFSNGCFSYKKAENLKKGCKIVSINHLDKVGEKAISPDVMTKEVLASRPIKYSGFVYDLSVNPKTPNFALSNGVVVHNSTRAEIIQKLMNRGYLQGTKNFTPSSIGFAVVDTLEKYSEDITNPKMTSDLEKEMDEVEKGNISKDKVVVNSRKMLHSVLKKLEKNKESIGEKLKTASFDDYVLGKCPGCGGTLRAIRTKRGTRFVGCSGYKEGCRVSFPLPAKGMLQPLNTACKDCELPMIRIINKGKRPYEMCVNHKCKSKEGWGKKKEEKSG